MFKLLGFAIIVVIVGWLTQTAVDVRQSAVPDSACVDITKPTGGKYSHLFNC
jgi:hypothetical protein